MTIIWLLVGLGLIVLGADWLVDGASSIARRAGVSEFVIGLTIVGFGTSCPELVVSLTGAFEGNADIAIGNVIGSNIFNVLFILGLTSLLRPVGMTADNRRKDIPLALAATLFLLACGLGHTLLGLGQHDRLSRVEGAVFLCLFAAYIADSFRSGKPSAEESGERTGPACARKHPRIQRIQHPADPGLVRLGYASFPCIRDAGRCAGACPQRRRASPLCI